MRPATRWGTLMAVAVGLATGPALADAAADALEPHVGKTLDVVEMGNGRRFVRPLLERITVRKGTTTDVRIVEEGRRRVTSLTLRGIVKIVVDRETVYEAEPGGAGAAGPRGRIAREQRDRELAESRARMEANGVTPWPELSAADHAAEVERLRAFVDRIRAAFPRLELHQTHEFLVATDIPAAETGPYLASLDALHDLLCDLYGIPRGEPLWKGKCLVVAFRDEDDFHAFEGRFMGADVPRGVHGLCHQSSDGRVVMACHRGRDLDAFAHMLVHETSHGFNHRWMSPQRLPNWLNEGLAEWVGTQVVPRSRQVPLKEAKARAFMQQTGSLGPQFFTAENIQPLQYGIASQLVKFLVIRDRKKFGEFVRGIKEGMTAEESLQAAYHGSLTDLIAAFGKAIGAPALKP
jgi:hypothetical protein